MGNVGMFRYPDGILEYRAVVRRFLACVLLWLPDGVQSQIKARFRHFSYGGTVQEERLCGVLSYRSYSFSISPCLLRFDFLGVLPPWIHGLGLVMHTELRLPPSHWWWNWLAVGARVSLSLSAGSRKLVNHKLSRSSNNKSDFEFVGAGPVHGAHHLRIENHWG